MKKILSVDDEPTVLRCIKASLEGAGYEVVTTPDPATALRILGEQDFDLVMLDIRMPGISGFEVYMTLKEKDKHNTPVLFVTAFPASFSAESEPLVKMWQDQFADGNTDILYKPFDLSTLIEKVEALIGPAKETE